MIIQVVLSECYLIEPPNVLRSILAWFMLGTPIIVTNAIRYKAIVSI